MIEIIAKGLLSLTETRIAFYIIRWSWGFEDRKNKRRQDWTQSKTVKEIAKDINLNYWWCAPVVKKMLEEEKLLRNKEGGWQFNEHYEKWKVKESLTVKENLSKGKLNSKLRNPSLQVKENLTQKCSKTNNNKKSQPPKETLKETLKETYIVLSQKLGELILERKPDYKAILKQQEKGWIDWADDIRLMVERDNRKVEKIKEVIDWCQEDDFWKNNILSTYKLRKQFDKLEIKMKEQEEDDPYKNYPTDTEY